MDQYSKNMKSLQNTTRFFGVFLIFTDIYFLIMSVVCNMPLMRYVVYFKLVVNSTNLFIIYKKRYIIANVIINMIITGFMVIAIMCLGLEPGFQYYAMGMIACSSYMSYITMRVYKRELPAAVMVAFHVGCYTFACIYNRSFGQIYYIDRFWEDMFLFFNSVASFGFATVFLKLFRDIALESEEKLEKMALVDNLTGLYNRHYMLAFLDRVPENERSGYWLAMLDIDDFKNVNDTYGHNCGDMILRQVASHSCKVCRNCTVCRWGGEEFIILAAGCNKNVLERLRADIENTAFEFEGKTIRVTVTIGVSDFNGKYNIDTWVSAADERLYYGKQHGKNQVVDK